eukprot:TRINITY_DN192468_c0_g1_i1.p2 TRINITY_DN192468_c0_g1~~TRINITY_DN192468_c0_g1_i1.p2  ORF type:complete len:142 (-),score=17.06 TRINITY_DN192468_c0_g1_i1:349-774(-)
MVSSGKCKWFDSTRGFGFIETDDGSGDVFVHQTAIKADGFRSLAEGEAVVFDLKVDGQGRRQALNVTGPSGDNVKGADRRTQRGGGAGGRGAFRVGYTGGYSGGAYGGGYPAYGHQQGGPWYESEYGGGETHQWHGNPGEQ